MIRRFKIVKLSDKYAIINRVKTFIFNKTVLHTNDLFPTKEKAEGFIFGNNLSRQYYKGER